MGGADVAVMIAVSPEEGDWTKGICKREKEREKGTPLSAVDQENEKYSLCCVFH